MGYTPPSTRTKDDANKELKEIELKINEEKQKLYIVVKERENAEQGFVDRENKCKNIETTLAESAESLSEKITENTKIVKEQENEIAQNTSKINNAVEQFNSISSEILSVQSILKDKIEESDETIVKKKEVIEKLDKEISEKTDTSTAYGTMVDSKKKQCLELEEKMAEMHKTLDEREKSLTKREIEQETKLSNIRTISVRLHNKYKDKMSEFEVTQTTI